MAHDYWIGDRVWISSRNASGIFEGEQGDQAIVKIAGQKQLFPFSELSLMQEEEEDFLLQELTEGSDKKFTPFEKFPDTLDLHIEELNPALIEAEPAQILAHQKTRLKEYLQSAIQKHIRRVTIIHGVGEGVLRAEVLSVLNEFSEVKQVEHESHGGAIIVHLAAT